MGKNSENSVEYDQRCAANGNERQRFQHEYVDEYEDVDEYGDEKSIIKNQSCCYRRRGRSAGAREEAQQEWAFLPADSSAQVADLLRGDRLFCSHRAKQPKKFYVNQQMDVD